MGIDHYTRWALIHLGLGMAAQVSGLFAKVHMLVAFVYFLYLIIKNSNKNHEALQAAAYMTGAEVFFRMTNAAPLYETGKYSVAGFLLLGILYQSIRRSAIVYVFYIALLLPSILVTLSYFDPEFNVRTSVIFNLSGPITLGLSAIYCYSRPINHEVFYRVTEKLLFPILSTAIYVQFYSMNIQAEITGTGSNFAFSGGFGPNQVSTILGLGSFLLFMRFFTKLKFKLNLFDAALFLFVTYRAFLTFSRGGVFVAVVMMAILLFIIFLRQPVSFKATFGIKMIFVGAALLVAWTYAVFKTDGLLQYRYENKDAAGRVKEDVTTGREQLVFTELDAFFKNPITGIGAGRIKVYRFKESGVEAASHNEVSRLLSEHGLFGLAALMLLLIVPVWHYFTGSSNYLMLSLLAFWFLTINHSSMRIAAPAFIYGLALLNIYYPQKIKSNQQIVPSKSPVYA